MPPMSALARSFAHATEHVAEVERQVWQAALENARTDPDYIHLKKLATDAANGAAAYGAEPVAALAAALHLLSREARLGVGSPVAAALTEDALEAEKGEAAAAFLKEHGAELRPWMESILDTLDVKWREFAAAAGGAVAVGDDAAVFTALDEAAAFADGADAEEADLPKCCVPGCRKIVFKNRATDEELCRDHKFSGVPFAGEIAKLARSSSINISKYQYYLKPSCSGMTRHVPSHGERLPVRATPPAGVEGAAGPSPEGDAAVGGRVSLLFAGGLRLGDVTGFKGGVGRYTINVPVNTKNYASCIPLCVDPVTETMLWEGKEEPADSSDTASEQGDSYPGPPVEGAPTLAELVAAAPNIVKAVDGVLPDLTLDDAMMARLCASPGAAKLSDVVDYLIDLELEGAALPAWTDPIAEETDHLWDRARSTSFRKCRLCGEPGTFRGSLWFAFCEPHKCIPVVRSNGSIELRRTCRECGLHRLFNEFFGVNRALCDTCRTCRDNKSMQEKEEVLARRDTKLTLLRAAKTPADGSAGTSRVREDKGGLGAARTKLAPEDAHPVKTGKAAAKAAVEKTTEITQELAVKIMKECPAGLSLPEMVVWAKGRVPVECDASGVDAAELMDELKMVAWRVYEPRKGSFQPS